MDELSSAGSASSGGMEGVPGNFDEEGDDDKLSKENEREIQAEKSIVEAIVVPEKDVPHPEVVLNRAPDHPNLPVPAVEADKSTDLIFKSKVVDVLDYKTPPIPQSVERNEESPAGRKGMPIENNYI